MSPGSQQRAGILGVEEDKRFQTVEDVPHSTVRAMSRAENVSAPPRLLKIGYGCYGCFSVIEAQGGRCFRTPVLIVDGAVTG